MGKKHKANNKKSDGKLTRKQTRTAGAPTPVNRITGIPAALPQPSSAALPAGLPRVARNEPTATPVVSLPAPTHPGLVRLCQFLRDRAGGAPVSKKT